jgi:hypothetical protein
LHELSNLLETTTCLGRCDVEATAPLDSECVTVV